MNTGAGADVHPPAAPFKHFALEAPPAVRLNGNTSATLTSTQHPLDLLSSCLNNSFCCTDASFVEPCQSRYRSRVIIESVWRTGASKFCPPYTAKREVVAPG